MASLIDPSDLLKYDLQAYYMFVALRSMAHFRIGRSVIVTAIGTVTAVAEYLEADARLRDFCRRKNVTFPEFPRKDLLSPSEIDAITEARRTHALDEKKLDEALKRLDEERTATRESRLLEG